MSTGDLFKEYLYGMLITAIVVASCIGTAYVLAGLASYIKGGVA